MPVDDISFYKIKEELSGEVDERIRVRFENEKALLKDYITLGAKIAAIGVAAAAVAIAYLGYNTSKDVHTTVEAEIKRRLNEENPVQKYSDLLRDRALDAFLYQVFAKSLSEIGNDRISSDQSLSFLKAALTSTSVSLDQKANILWVISGVSDNDVKLDFARTSIPVVELLLDKPLNNQSRTFIEAAFNLYGAVAGRSNEFAGQVQKFAEQFIGDSRIARSAARFATFAPGSVGATLLKILEQNKDDRVQLRLIQFKATGKIPQPNDQKQFEEIVSRMLDTTFSEGYSYYQSDWKDEPAVTSAIDALSLTSEGDNLVTLAAVFARVARAKNIVLTNEVASEADGQYRTRIALSDGKRSFGISSLAYFRLLRSLSSRFWLRVIGNKRIDEEGLNTLAYFIGVNGRSSYVQTSAPAYFIYATRTEKYFDLKGSELAIAPDGENVNFRIATVGGAPRLRVLWWESGINREADLGSIDGLTDAPELRTFQMWKSPE